MAEGLRAQQAPRLESMASALGPPLGSPSSRSAQWEEGLWDGLPQPRANARHRRASPGHLPEDTGAW